MASSTQLKLKDGSNLTNATSYRQLVGSLQYLAMIRPDISFAVNKLAKFMHSPIETHWSHLKRVMQYLKGTLHHGLLLNKNTKLEINTYSDADQGGNADDKTSTIGYIVFLGSSPISWKSSKKKMVARFFTEVEYRVLASVRSFIATKSTQ